MTFLSKKVIFSSKCGCISSTILTFLPNNPVCFYTKNSQKVHFPSNCAYNTGHFSDFSPKKSDFFLKRRLHIGHYFDFIPKIPKKLNFPQIETIIQGTLLTFLQKLGVPEKNKKKSKHLAEISKISLIFWKFLIFFDTPNFFSQKKSKFLQFLVVPPFFFIFDWTF